MTESLFEDLMSKLSPGGEGGSPFRRYGLEENPFPSSSVTQDRVLWNQEAIREALDKKIREFVLQGLGTAGFLVSGGNRTGKSTLLKYYHRRLSGVFTAGPPGSRIAVVYLVASSQGFLEDYREIMAQLRTLPLTGDGRGLPESLMDWLTALDGAHAGERIESAGPGDLKRALKSLMDGWGSAESDASRCDRLWTWMSGRRLYKEDLRLLQVEDRIETSGQAIRLLRYLLRMLRQSGLLRGVMLMVDEIEHLWAVSPRARHQSLQDWRHLIDEIDEGLFLVMASAEGPGAQLRTDYPALAHRLEGAGGAHVLGLVASDREAWECARAFLDDARARAQAAGVHPVEGAGALVNADDVRAAFAKVAREARQVPTGILLDELHRIAEERARGVG